MSRYEMIFVGSLESFLSATGVVGKSNMPEGFRDAVDILFGSYIEKWSDKRGIKRSRAELFTGIEPRSDTYILLEDLGKLPNDSCVLARIGVDNKEYIPHIVDDMSSLLGLDIEYCDVPEPCK
jgi:hypothetical protein